MEKKVLIIIFTDGKLPRKVYRAACSQDYPNRSVLISVVKSDPKKNVYDNIKDHMNYVRKLAAVSDADYFFFVESGVVIPKNAVSNLMKQFEQPPLKQEVIQLFEKSAGRLIEQPPKKHIIGGWYKLTNASSVIWKNVKHKIPTLWSPSRLVANNMINSLAFVEPSVVRVHKIASGCIMLSREVLEKIEWRTDWNYRLNFKDKPEEGSPVCMCYLFGMDAQDAGYELWMDGSVVCKHLTVPDNLFEKLILCLKKRFVRPSHQC